LGAHSTRLSRIVRRAALDMAESKSSTFSHLTKALLTIILICGMIFYTFNSIRKFQEHKIAVATQKDFAEEELWFPHVTLCANFRQHSNNPERIVYNAVQEGKEDASNMDSSVAKSISFERREILSYFVQGVRNNWTALDYLNDEEVWTEEFHEYWGGRCHTWTPKVPTIPGETNALVLGFKNIGDFVFNRY